MTTDKILDKLSKLKAAAEGEAKIGNAAAAEAFAEAINRLLLQHELTMADVPEGGVVKDEPIVEVLVDRDAYGIGRSKVRIGWQEALAGTVARAHMCRTLAWQGSNHIAFVGTKQHATVAEYAYGVLARAADEMSIEARDEYWRKHRNDPDFQSGNFRAAWLTGFIQRIGERLEEAKRKEAAATGNASTALVKIDTALERVADHMKKQGVKKMPGAAMRSGISRGREEGRRAADDVRLHKGVERGDAKPLLKK